jgi:hypothetical protein
MLAYLYKKYPMGWVWMLAAQCSLCRILIAPGDATWRLI